MVWFNETGLVKYN